MDRRTRLLLVAGTTAALLAAWAGAASAGARGQTSAGARAHTSAGAGTQASAGVGGGPSANAQVTARFAPYTIPPREPRPTSAAARSLLRGSSVTSRDAWIVVHLRGGPYRIGFQNGYLTAQSSDYAIRVDMGPRGSSDRKRWDKVARLYIWRLVPGEYRRELRGIADGMHAAGYTRDTLWDVVAANAWADEACYDALLPGAAVTSAATPQAADAASGSDSSTAGAATGATAGAATAGHRAGKGGCSAFIATGGATVDGRPVMGHNTWADYAGSFMYNVMFYVHPSRGFDFSYQSSGGSIWSGVDWYENSAGLLLTETTLADSTYTRTGVPVFVRARETAQYDATVAQAVHTLIHRNNGAYSNEWLIGDRTGEIASLQLGNKAHDLHETRDGYFGSSNFDWGPKTRAEEIADKSADGPDPYNPAVVDYARYVRWGQLQDLYHGTIDAQVGMAMESDTYDTYLGQERADARDICGEPEHSTPGLLGWDSWVLDPQGAIDGKVCTEAMALDGLQSWACWGHGSGDHFDAAAYLARHRSWAAGNGALAVFGLETFSAQNTDRWVRLRGDRSRQGA